MSIRAWVFGLLLAVFVWMLIALPFVAHAQSTTVQFLNPTIPQPVTPSYPLPVTSINPASIYTGQQTVTMSAVALPTHSLYNGLAVCAALTNAAPIYVGPSGVTTSTGFPIGPSPASSYCVSFAVQNANDIFIRSGANTTDTVSFEGN
jgi:hypothetical protein